MTEVRARETVRRALDTPRITLGDLAAIVGVDRGTLETYRSGAALMPYPLRLRLAAFLEGQARALLTLAEELRESDPPGPAQPEASAPRPG